jgi:hypothetical protein
MGAPVAYATGPKRSGAGGRRPRWQGALADRPRGDPGAQNFKDIRYNILYLPGS